MDLFEAVPFGTDQRGRPVAVTLMFASCVIGVDPAHGQDVPAAPAGLIAALDARAELHLFDLKGTGDLSPLEAVAHRYRAGEEDDDIAYALAAMRELAAEVRRRARVIRDLPRDICPENKVTPDLASNKTLGLHPIGDLRGRVPEVVRAPQARRRAGRHLHRPGETRPRAGHLPDPGHPAADAKSLPTGISANAVLRMCLKVMGQTENDMVLGTSAYKNGVRATMFAFSDKGIFYFAGEGDAPRIVRGYEVDAPTAEKIALRARALRERAGTLSGHALGRGTRHRPPVRPAGRPGRRGHRTQGVVRDRRHPAGRSCGPAPTAWADLEPDARAAQLTAALKPYGIRTGQVWGTTADGKGANRRGITRDDITKAITERNEDRAGRARLTRRAASASTTPR